MFFESLFLIDTASLPFIILTILLFGICLYVSGCESNSVNYISIVLSILGLLFVLFLSWNIFIFLIYYEILVMILFLCLFLFIASFFRVRTAFYFFIFSLFGSIFFFYIVTILPMFWKVVLISNAIIFSLPFLIKLPTFPFSYWLPEVHTEANTSISIILAGLILKLGIFGIIRYCYVTYDLFFSILNSGILVLVLVVILLIMCAFFRFIVDLKKIIAFSSITHLNLTFGALITFNNSGILTALITSFAHGLSSVALFMFVGSVIVRTYSRNIDSLFFLDSSSRTILLFLLLFNLSFPLTLNFIGELLAVVSLISVSVFFTFIFLVSSLVFTLYWFFIYNRKLSNFPLRLNLFSTEKWIIIWLITLLFYSGTFLILLIYSFYLFALYASWIAELFTNAFKNRETTKVVSDFRNHRLFCTMCMLHSFGLGKLNNPGCSRFLRAMIEFFNREASKFKLFIFRINRFLTTFEVPKCKHFALEIIKGKMVLFPCGKLRECLHCGCCSLHCKCRNKWFKVPFLYFSNFLNNFMRVSFNYIYYFNFDTSMLLELLNFYRSSSILRTIRLVYFCRLGVFWFDELVEACLQAIQRSKRSNVIILIDRLFVFFIFLNDLFSLSFCKEEEELKCKHFTLFVCKGNKINKTFLFPCGERRECSRCGYCFFHCKCGDLREWIYYSNLFSIINKLLEFIVLWVRKGGKTISGKTEVVFRVLKVLHSYSHKLFLLGIVSNRFLKRLNGMDSIKVLDSFSINNSNCSYVKLQFLSWNSAIEFWGKYSHHFQLPRFYATEYWLDIYWSYLCFKHDKF